VGFGSIFLVDDIREMTTMYTSNNQVIFEENYDETFQPTDEELNEYAEFIGVDPLNVSVLAWFD
jgi:hypothetical protein